MAGITSNSEHNNFDGGATVTARRLFSMLQRFGFRPLCILPTIVLCSAHAFAQTNASATPPTQTPSEKRVLFSKAFAERATSDSIIIQVSEDDVLIFDTRGPYTLYDPNSKKAKNLIIIAKH